MSNKGFLGLAVVLIGGICAVFAFGLRTVPTVPPVETSVHDFTMKNIDGREVKLDEYKDKVVLIVNTASKCGLTPQYEGLQNLYDKYKDKGFFVLGFPANNFMGQEPGTEQEIKEFCTLKYKVTFPMFSKISVKGDDQHALYRYLTGQKDFGGDITWNFEKFLVDGNGRVIARFSPSTKPDDPALVAAVEKALK
ncbi:MAG: glutathione peroxidase [Acidobacteria bacterium]|nr:glutathione peroxidase [Acidobacteriota bacterium]